MTTVTSPSSNEGEYMPIQIFIIIFCICISVIISCICIYYTYIECQNELNKHKIIPITSFSDIKKDDLPA